MYVYKRFSLLLFAFLCSCSNPLPALENIDTERWKEDRNGCTGTRTGMIQAITDQKDELKKLSEMDVVQLLGRPDENQLLERNQKFYTYYLEPGPLCENSKEGAKKLILRFNAMGLAKEVMIK